MREQAKNDKLRSKKALPCRECLTPPRQGLVDRQREDADYRGEGLAGVAEALDQEVCGSVPGATDGVAEASLPPSSSGWRRRWGCRPTAVRGSLGHGTWCPISG